MDPQLVDWGSFVGMLAIGVAILRVVSSGKETNRRLDRQDEHLAELRADMKEGQAELKEGQAGLRADMKEGQVRIDGNILRIVGDLGEVRGELKRIVPREKVAAGGS